MTGENGAPPSAAVKLDSRLILSWFNRITKLLQDDKFPQSTEIDMAIGLLFAMRLRATKFSLSEGVRAFKQMWVLDAQTQDIPLDAAELSELTASNVKPVGAPKFGSDLERHGAGHPGETSPELECKHCREEIRAAESKPKD